MGTVTKEFYVFDFRALWRSPKIKKLTSMSVGTCRSHFTWYIPTVCVARVLAHSSDFWLLGEQSLQKWEIPCDPVWTPMNRRAKFDAAYFILWRKQ